MNIIPIDTATERGRADLSRTLRGLGTAGVELAQAEAGVRTAFAAYRQARMLQRRGGFPNALTPAKAREWVRLAIIRLRLARVCK